MNEEELSMCEMKLQSLSRNKLIAYLIDNTVLAKISVAVADIVEITTCEMYNALFRTNALNIS